MIDNSPILSIIIPTKNRSEFLKSSAGRFLIFKPTLEVIVIDDGSNDIESKNNKDFIFNNGGIYKKNDISVGAARSRNIGSHLSNAKYIWYFDDDDEPDSKTIEDIIEYLKIKNPQNAMLLPMSIKFNLEIVKSIYPKNEENTFEYYRKYSHQVNTSCAIFPKKILQQLNFWDEELVSGQDTDLFFRVSSICRFETVSTIPVIVNVGHKDRMTIRPRKQMKGYIQFLNKHWRELAFRKTILYTLRIIFFTPYIRYIKYKLFSKKYQV